MANILFRQIALIAAGFMLGIVVHMIFRDNQSNKVTINEQLGRSNAEAPSSDTKLVYKPPTQVHISQGNWKEGFEKLSLAEKEDEFYVYVQKLQTNCKKMVRLGRMQDGGWEVCLEPGLRPSAPCLVYSFGINNIWDFDDGAAGLGCEVHSFDPSMKRGDFLRGERIHFHNLGLDGFNGTDKRGWNMKTLGAIRKDLGHTDKVIDILKMDIEFSEWAAFAQAFKENSLKNVKQLMMEIHTSMMIALKKPVDDQAYTSMYSIFKQLEELGFKMYWSTTNIQDRHQSPTTGKTRFCCFEIYWLNTNYRES